MTDDEKREYIAALLAERGHYEKQGKTDRVAAVDVELRRLGQSAKPPAKRAVKRGG